jgi:hypothetical protein
MDVADLCQDRLPRFVGDRQSGDDLHELQGDHRPSLRMAPTVPRRVDIMAPHKVTPAMTHGHVAAARQHGSASAEHWRLRPLLTPAIFFTRDRKRLVSSLVCDACEVLGRVGGQRVPVIEPYGSVQHGTLV